MEVSIEQAAVLLNVSGETIRRRVRRGVIPSRRGEDGRLLVSLPEHSEHTEEPIDHADEHTEHKSLSALVDEKDRRIAELTATVEDLRRQLEAAAVDRHELLLIVQRQQVTIEALTPRLPSGPSGVPYETKAGPGRPWWRWWR